MLILETERRSSPFIVDRTIIGHRPSLLKSATGRAYLAFCPDEERQQLLDVLRKSGHPDDSLANIPQLIDRIIDETRRHGYGVRELARRTRISDTDRDFNAIAVPVIVRKRVVACINALWIEHVMGVEEFATLYLPALRDAANGLARSVMRQTGNTIRGATATKSARAEKP
jgi:IclR family mhp operon transcriptional activator